MPPDLIIYGLVAAGLIFWLRSILGTRSGDERERKNPYLAPDGKISADPAVGIIEIKGPDSENLIAELARAPKDNMSIANKTAEMVLLDIARTDKTFDIIKFLRAAQDAFVYIVEAFAEGDRESLKDLLGPAVYDAFENAITQRQNAGETMKSEIHAIRKSEIVECRMDGRLAFVTVRFLADETSVTRDQNSNIIHGHPEKTTQMRDVWTFSRDLKSRDPRWFLVETREDIDGDNPSIPNTH